HLVLVPVRDGRAARPWPSTCPPKRGRAVAISLARLLPTPKPTLSGYIVGVGPRGLVSRIRDDHGANASDPQQNPVELAAGNPPRLPTRELAMKAVAVLPGRPNSVHLRDIPAP